MCSNARIAVIILVVLAIGKHSCSFLDHTTLPESAHINIPDFAEISKHLALTLYIHNKNMKNIIKILFEMFIFTRNLPFYIFIPVHIYMLTFVF